MRFHQTSDVRMFILALGTRTMINQCNNHTPSSQPNRLNQFLLSKKKKQKPHTHQRPSTQIESSLKNRYAHYIYLGDWPQQELLDMRIIHNDAATNKNHQTVVGLKWSCCLPLHDRAHYMRSASHERFGHFHASTGTYLYLLVIQLVLN